MSSKKSTPSVKVVNPRALPPGINLSPDPIESVLPDPNVFGPKEPGRLSDRMKPGPGVRVVSKVERSV